MAKKKASVKKTVKKTVKKVLDKTTVDEKVVSTAKKIDWINGFRAGNKKELYCLCCRLGTFTLFELEYCPCSKKGCSKVRFMICNMGFEI